MLTDIKFLVIIYPGFEFLKFPPLVSLWCMTEKWTCTQWYFMTYAWCWLLLMHISLFKWWNQNLAGTCLMKYLVCLVIDEAHRALGNYSYCVAVREVCCSVCNVFISVGSFTLSFYFNLQGLYTVTSMGVNEKYTIINMILNVQLTKIPLPLRILALTATPGCKFLSIFFPYCSVCLYILNQLHLLSKASGCSANHWQLTHFNPSISWWKWSWCQSICSWQENRIDSSMQTLSLSDVLLS